AAPRGLPESRRGAGDRRGDLHGLRRCDRRRPGRAGRRHARHRRDHGPHRRRAHRRGRRARGAALRGDAMARVSAPDFWDDLYSRGGDGWDLGRAAPPLVDVLDTTPPPRGRVAVPGCGRGHDARLLAARGYEVTAFDFVPAVLDEARRLAARERVTVSFEQRDVFTLARDLPHAFDGIWEYTCYCAIDPARRAEYVRALAGTLRAGGWLLACFF